MSNSSKSNVTTSTYYLDVWREIPSSPAGRFHCDYFENKAVGKKYNEGQHCAGQTKRMNSPFNLWSTVVTLPPWNGHTRASTKAFGCVPDKGAGDEEHRAAGLQALSPHHPEQLSFYLVYLLVYHVITYLKSLILPQQIHVWKVLAINVGLESTSKANIQANTPPSMDCCSWGVVLA